MPFAAWLKDARVRRGLTQDRVVELAREFDPDCSMWQGRLTEWEAGKRAERKPKPGREPKGKRKTLPYCLPSLRQLHALDHALGLSVDEAREGRGLWEAAQLHNESPATALEEAVTVTT